MSNRYEDERYYNQSSSGIPASVVEAEVDRLLKLRLAQVYDWASNPEYDPGDCCHYGDAQIHVLGLLTDSVIDHLEWVDGEYRRELDPA